MPDFSTTSRIKNHLTLFVVGMKINVKGWGDFHIGLIKKGKVMKFWTVGDHFEGRRADFR